MGLVAAFMVRNWVQQRTVVASAPTGTIVVAAAPLGFGAELTGDNITEIRWPAANLPEGAFASKKELLKDGRRTVLKPLEKSEPVLRGKITGPGQRASLSSLLGDGRKAVTIRVDDVKGVAGFVLPGDHVDVVLIRSDKGDSYSDILVQHVKVLAVDQLANERQEKAKLARAVTLDVTTEQAQKIVLASTVGRLSLILRPAAQAKQESSRRVTTADLGRDRSEPSFITVQPPKPEAPQIVRVDVIRGTARSTYNVEQKTGEVRLLGN